MIRFRFPLPSSPQYWGPSLLGMPLLIYQHSQPVFYPANRMNLVSHLDFIILIWYKQHLQMCLDICILCITPTSLNICLKSLSESLQKKSTLNILLTGTVEEKSLAVHSQNSSPFLKNSEGIFFTVPIDHMWWFKVNIMLFRVKELSTIMA